MIILRKELLDLATDLIRQGIRLLPLGPNKQPYWPLLPKVARSQKDGTIKMVASWKALLAPGATTPSQVEFWLQSGATGLGAVCGHTYSDGLYVFDVDVAPFYQKWLANKEVARILSGNAGSCTPAAIQKTGGGGYQIAIKVEGEVPGNSQFAWAPDESQHSGRTIALESRGEGGYIVGPYSIHPSGTYYKPLNPKAWANIPRIKQEDLETLSQAARNICEAPKTRQQLEQEKRLCDAALKQARSRPTYRTCQNGESIIDRINSDMDITQALSRCGYTEEPSGRWVRPGGKSGSIVIFNHDNMSYHHSTNDPMNDGYAKTPFNLICYYEHHDDVTEAVKAIAEELGLDYASQMVADAHREALYSWPTFDAKTVVKLEEGQYFSDVVDLNSYPPNQRHYIQAGTGSGKTYACFAQLPNLVHAVPFVGAVKQFSSKYGAAPIYEGQPFNPIAYQHVTTYDGLNKIVSAHIKGLIDLAKVDLVVDECHHPATDGFRIGTMRLIQQVAPLFRRVFYLSGTQPPLADELPDTRTSVVRDNPKKPWQFVESEHLPDLVATLFDYWSKRLGEKPLIDVHLNDKDLGAAYAADLAKEQQDLSSILINKETEEEAYHQRILLGDGYIDDSVDVIWRTSIIDDGVDVYGQRPVINVVVSLLPPMIIEQQGARWRGNLPVHTYLTRIVGNKSKNQEEEQEKKPTFHMLDQYLQELDRLERRLEGIEILLETEKETKDDTFEEIARQVVWGNLLKDYIIKGDKIQVDRLRVIQRLTLKWAGYCKRETEAMADALRPYGYVYEGVATVPSNSGAKARKRRALEDRKERKKARNERIRQAAQALTVVRCEELVETGGSRADTPKEVAEKRAAEVLIEFYDAGLTFEAAKGLVSNSSGFHKTTIKNQMQRIRASFAYECYKAGRKPKTSTSRMLTMLFRWLEQKQASGELITPEAWRDAVGYATRVTGDEGARLQYFAGKSQDANQKARGRFLSTLADVTRAQETIEGQRVDGYRVKAVGRFSDTDLRLSGARGENEVPDPNRPPNLQNAADKTEGFAYKTEVLSAANRKQPGQIPSKDKPEERRL